MALTVNDQQLGTTEATWLGPGLLQNLAPLSWRPPQRAVVVAPHPDDEVLGVGGLIARLSGAGTDIGIVAVTDGEASHPNSTRVAPRQMAERRAKERTLALDRLGVRPGRVTTLGLPDGHVAAEAGRLKAAIAEALGDGDGADVVCLAPWRHDGHPDHDAAGQAAAAACTEAGATLAEYLVWAWHWATPSSVHIDWSSARRIDLSRSDVAQKRWAIAGFRSQIRAIGPDAGDAAILPADVLARFRRPFEVVFL